MLSSIVVRWIFQTNILNTDATPTLRQKLAFLMIFDEPLCSYFDILIGFSSRYSMFNVKQRERSPLVEYTMEPGMAKGCPRVASAWKRGRCFAYFSNFRPNFQTKISQIIQFKE